MKQIETKKSRQRLMQYPGTIEQGFRYAAYALLGYLCSLSLSAGAATVYSNNFQGSDLVLNFSAYGLQGLADESWGLDNVRVDVAPIPLPAAVWLFGSGLLGLIGMARHKHVNADKETMDG